ncbi:polysaccharide pyruvyl transferase family protein [Rhodococcus erythropolis]|nr:polysaccharide pyruvyl transferase family protein [Rhodococcus erythropolis]
MTSGRRGSGRLLSARCSTRRFLMFPRPGARMSEVEVVNWNPRNQVVIPGISRKLRIGRRINNFGDLLGPVVVAWMSKQSARRVRSKRDRRLLSVGSIMHMARTGDCIWGTGVNGKITPDEYRFDALDVRAVRGPLSREFLEKRGIHTPPTYGDPGLLIPSVFPELVELTKNPSRDVVVVPNLNDLPRWFDTPSVLDPTEDLQTCLRTIASSRLVVGSSLHAVIVADALGVPARLIPSGSEAEFKYADYYLGTGRELSTAPTVKAAISRGGAPGLGWNDGPLREAFPHDLFGK